MLLYTSELNDTSRRSFSRRDSAICCFKFEEDDYVRTLPLCSQTFHVDCIDAWLRSHTNCPLYRTGVLSAALLFTPMFAARIRPSFDADEYGLKSAGNVRDWTPVARRRIRFGRRGVEHGFRFNGKLDISIIVTPIEAVNSNSGLWMNIGNRSGSSRGGDGSGGDDNSGNGGEEEFGWSWNLRLEKW
ncbi:hypothetical protein Ahy_B02g058908 [Arachis hypogaea]|uniref:RING-type E3 ubiquitin transferase n=1 Tax=Arachis hypogaea TaxID=3818 RepID=A0A445AFR9_ARAHY|nr:hypothetical protein Ahy_B02g058908 [Arachis hypogaea]